MSWVPMRVGVLGLLHEAHSGIQERVSIVGISNSYLKFARNSAMAASHTQAHSSANGKLGAWSSQMFSTIQCRRLFGELESH
jgi:hypothetical protein